MTGTRAVIAAVALLLGLSACSGEDPKPHVAPPSPSAPSTTGTSVETPPEMPDAAKGTDAAAAEAFVKFYWDAVAYAQRTGDLSLVREISSEKCIACQAGIDYLQGVFDKGGVIEGGVSTVESAETVFGKDERSIHAVVEFDLRTTGQRVDYPGNLKDEAYRGGLSTMRARLDPSGSSWVMTFWDKL